MQKAISACVVALFAVGLTWVFWWPLWEGGGLIGGDLYPYYFPQKAVLADALANTEIPFWNPLVGFGYPVLGESQTGALYPVYLILYRFLDINSAYNFSQLLHYVIAFVSTYGVARRLGLGRWPSLLAAVTFVYGWFPARICLEWAIVGGAWSIAFLWAETVFLQSRNRWSLAAMSLILGLNLLAGHYNLAFITILLAAVWPWLISRRESDQPGLKVTKLIAIAGALMLGFAIAGVQIIPTWELKSVSQRQEEAVAFTPTYGHLPPAAISQLWTPWSWYAGEMTTDEYLVEANWLAVPDSTNQVEAYVYCGILPLVLAILGIFFRSHGQLSGVQWRWWGIFVVGLLMATGWPTYWLADVPGIGFFRGPGRYSMISAFAVAILAGNGFQSLVSQRNSSKRTKNVFGLVVVLIVVGDLWVASRKFQVGSSPFWMRQVFYATLLDDPPITYRDESELREYFRQLDGNVRLYAPGQNMPTLLGVSSLPVYLGLGPAIYETQAVRVDLMEAAPERIQEERSRLEQLGVTHILSEHPLNETLWNVNLESRPVDALLNRAFGRREPFYFYSLTDASGRCHVPEDPDAVVTLSVSPNEVIAEVNNSSGGTLELRDLNYPGWVCTSHEELDSELYRTVKLTGGDEEVPERVRWVFRPRSHFLGAILSSLGLIGMIFFPIWIGRFINSKEKAVSSAHS
ncbi:hypothetical protein KOR42_07000 [Thalassoglobus neptunius]|uniref:Bacterial membrane protein YfhO n=1 Tax=Thalassoglobus neptunius TaxID=1938619 RepID=A0A5C5X3B6_9PLAN|nr:YfhO family protein [Thalassoglobus neptunius]TWT57340.1 hypothetical protein KOR42_07000 [Thalassoglobus neptunius]